MCLKTERAVDAGLWPFGFICGLGEQICRLAVVRVVHDGGQHKRLVRSLFMSQLSWAVLWVGGGLIYASAANTTIYVRFYMSTISGNSVTGSPVCL